MPTNLELATRASRIDELRRWGLIRILYRFCMERLDRWFGVFFVGVFQKTLRSADQPPEGVTVRIADQPLLEPYARNNEYTLPPSFLDSAFARGDECVATFVGERLAAFGWVSYCGVPHQGNIWVEYAEGYRYNYRSFTHPDFRGQHLRGSFGVLTERDQAEGVTHSICFIESHNFASTQAELRNRGTRIGFAGYVRNFGRPRCFRSPGARRAGFRFRVHPNR